MQISERLLTMSGFYFEVTGLSADRKPIYGAPVELGHIWVDYTSAQTSGNNGKEPGDNGTFFFDCANSTPHGFIPKKDSKIIVDDVELIIMSVHPCRGLNGLEHYECEVK